jgi:hypothetical protein
MKYTLQINESTFEVDGLEVGVLQGSSTGNIDLYIRIEDSDMDIYESPAKKDFWSEWVDQCCADKGNPETRVRKVVAKVMGGDKNNETWRTVTIEKGYISRFTEISDRGNPVRRRPTEYKYEATIRRAPNKKGEVSIKAG